MFLLIALFGLQNCNTVTGTVEGTTRGVVKDAKTLDPAIRNKLVPIKQKYELTAKQETELAAL